MRRFVQWMLAGAVLSAVASCKGGGGPGGTGSGSDGGTSSTGGGCPAGQTLQGSTCQPACAAGTQSCGSTCCGADQVCVAGNQCQGGADPACSWIPPKGPFTPRVAWQWTGSTNQPQYADVLASPVVIPLQQVTGDVFAAPAVVFNSVRGDQGAGSNLGGVMRAVSGRDGSEIWTSDPAHLVNGLASIAAADLTGDGFTEFVTARLGSIWPATDPGHHGPPTDDGLVAFDHQGRFLWEVVGPRVFWGAPSIANLYGGPEAQVIIGATVIDAHGTILCQGANGEGSPGIGENFLGPISTVADIDLDGVPDIVTGNTVYDNHCRPKPGWPNGLGDGLVAVARFTADPHPQIVVVSAGYVRLQDWQGKVIWGPFAIPPVVVGGPQPAGGGAPTIADFDGQGQLEIGVAGKSSYTVFKPFAANPVLWTKPTQDSSMVTGSSVFDFEHDGKAEVVYGDECYTRVYDGTTGATLFEAPNPSCTVHETPVVADVDRDGRAEIVVATNSVCDIQCPWGGHLGSGKHGVTVYKDLRDHWVSTRSVWNQHAYHVTNILDDGSVPVKEEPNWSASWFGEPLDDFRMNPIGNGDFRAPDLAAAPADVGQDQAACPARLRLTVKVWNRGAVLVTAGVPVALYEKATRKLLAVAKTAGAIVPGSNEVVAIDLAPAPATPVDLEIDVNDDGTGQGVVGECRTDNNVVALPQIYCPAASR